MMSPINSFVILFLILQLVGYYSNQFVRAVDLIDDKPNEVILGIICDSSPSSRDDQQIARITTLNKLEEFMSGLAEDDKHYKCVKENLASVRLLKDVVTKSNANVCSDEKISLIEKYHNLFVASGRDSEKLRHEQNRPPGLTKLNLFFQHYAMEVSAVCQTSLINNVEWHLQRVFGEDINEKLVGFSGQVSELSSGSLGVIFEGMIGKFMELFTVEQYDDALMIWDLIQGNVMKTDPEALAKQNSMFDPVTGELIKLRVKSKASNNFNQLRDHCHFKLKPIYSKLIVPLIRLSNMGYLNKGERFQIELNELKSNEKVKRWYAVTQVCEAILPIRSYEDPSMKFGDVIILTPDEARKLDELARAEGTPAEQQKALNYEPDTNSMEHIDLIESVQSIERQNIVNQIRSNLSARDRTKGRMIKNLLKHVAHELKSRAGKLLFPASTNRTEGAGSEKLEKAETVRRDATPELAYTIEQLTEEDLDEMGANPLTGAGIVQQKKRRRRKGDYEARAQERQTAVAVKRTMSCMEIFAPCIEFWKLLEPSWWTIFVSGTIVLGILVFFFISAVFLIHGR